MTRDHFALIAASLCLLVGLAALFRHPGKGVNWCFFIGMFLLAAELFLDGKVAATDNAASARYWLVRAMWVKSFLPVIWLGFSLVYARGNRTESLRHWKWLLVIACVVPAIALTGAAGDLLVRLRNDNIESIRFLPAGKAWLMLVLALTLGALVNLEKTFRASVGMARWRIKYMFLGLSMIFGVKIYTLSQILLFSGYDPALATLGCLGAVIGCGLIVIGQFRTGIGEIDIYPSGAVLQGSITLILVGAYFLIVGVLAQVVATMGGIASFPAQALVVLVGLVGSVVLLLSDRFRSSLKRFVSRHFRRAEHDFRKIWTEFTRRTSSVLDETTLGKNASEVISENFDVLGVTVFRTGTDSPVLNCLCSIETPQNHLSLPLDDRAIAEIRSLGRPFDLELMTATWAGELREKCPSRFEHGGGRLAVPLVASDHLVGLLVLADRVNGVPYSHEEIDLLACIGDQLAAAFLNCSLTEKVLQAKEMEAFQTLSTFFVHDLKNAANSLNLTLQNLPVHFDDPDFRADAVRSVGCTVDRINQMILKLSSLRHEFQLRRVPCRLDLVCAEILGTMDVEMQNGSMIKRDLQAVPDLNLDLEAMHSVITNLVINASDAMPGGGSITVATRLSNEKVVLDVTDEGGGMTENFIRNQLFRPFSSTKTKGLGIGMFQCRKIIEAHQGSISVKSATGSGTCVSVVFPIETPSASEHLSS